VARPFGALLFGHYGDRIGRRNVLAWTMAAMGVGTLTIALAPGFAAIGAAGGVIISLARILQGIGLAGETAGASVWTTETVAKSRMRATWSSVVQFGTPIGLLTSSAAFTLATSTLSHSAFLSYGWRIPFFAGAGVALVGLIIRLRLTDSQIFRSLKEEEKTERFPSFKLLKQNFGLVAKLAAAWAFLNASLYVSNTFGVSYLTTGLHMKSSFTSSLGIYSAVGIATFTPVGAYLADRVGRRPMLLISAAFVTIYPYFYFMMLNTTNPSTIIAAAFINGFQSVGFAPLAAFFPEQFPTKFRYSGTALTFQLASPFAGGLAPIIGAALVSAYGLSPGWILVSIMVSCYGVIGIIATLRTRETLGTSLTDVRLAHSEK